MGKAIPAHHPAVVLRSHYMQLRALLAIAMIAVVGLSAAVVILATNDERNVSAGAGAATQLGAPGPTGSTRDDGGLEAGSRAVAPAQPPHVRYDGGLEEGTAALSQRAASATVAPDSINLAPGVRYDGGLEEGSRGAPASDAHPDAVTGIRYDGGLEEGSRAADR